MNIVIDQSSIFLVSLIKEGTFIHKNGYYLGL